MSVITRIRLDKFKVIPTERVRNGFPHNKGRCDGIDEVQNI
jgi:hypothetical protein